MKGTVAVLLVFGLLQGTAGAVAQEVRGTVVAADAEVPIDGAFVSLVDADGAEITSALTSPDGAFLLHAFDRGRYRLRVQRIGFETWLSETFEAGPGVTVTRRLPVSVRPVDLSELTVAVEGRCARRPGAGHELLRVWEEARKALRVARWTEVTESIRFELLRWDRLLQPHSWRVESEDTSRGWKTGRSSFISLPAAQLAANGYVQRDEQSAYHFYAPDADVLLSDVFLEDHCLRLVHGEGENEAWVGLAFEPAERPFAPDVKGVLWLDPLTAELHHMEFEYTRLDRVDLPSDAWAGGRLEFRRAPTGAWFASRWWIRIPVHRRGVRPTLQRGVGGNFLSQRLATSLEAYREVGGEVVRLALPDGREIAMGEWGTLVGRAVSAVNDEPVVDATVRLVGTDRSTRTDSAGRFEIDFVAPGRYTVALEHPDPRLIGVPVDERDVTVTGEGIARLRLELSSERLVRRLCAPADAEGVSASRPLGLLGRVKIQETGEPLPDALVWLRAGQREEPVAVQADDGGSFLVCGLDPTGLVAQATGQGLLGRPDTIALPESGLVMHDLEVAPITLAEATSGAATGATLRGVVKSAESDEPVSGARVRLLGSNVERITGEDGTFVMAGVPVGPHRVVTEYLGAISDTAFVDLGGGTMSVAILTLETRPVQLPALHVEIERTRNLRLAGFYERMERKMGDFITREDLEARDIVANMRRIQGVRLEECVRRPSGIRAGALGPARPIERDGMATTAPGSRLRVSGCWEIEIGRRYTSDPDDRCAPLVFLNGHQIGGLTDPLMAGFTGENPFSVIERIPRDMIEGIEVHRNAATAPAQYHGYGAGCGVILVWTRGRG